MTDTEKSPASQLCSRRAFLKGVAALTVGLAAKTAPAITAPLDGRNIFTVKKRRGRWWLITPDGKPFFSLGLNHIDSSPLRYPESQSIWRDKYGNSTERWLKEAVAPDLRAWGFNSVGWTQEVVIRGDLIHRHSPAFTFEEYQWLGLPYCHLLPVAETHQWDNEVRPSRFLPTRISKNGAITSRAASCARFVGDPKLIGYFYTDCPCWVHTKAPQPLEGPAV